MTRRDPRPAMASSASSALQIEGLDHFERIGSGGFSAVYSARQTSLGRQVAVKVLTADVSEPADRRAFERECQALGLVSHHPNIVTIYNEAFTNDGRPCIVMELYGRNYRERLDEVGPLAVDEALSLGVKMSGALHSAHLDGVLHRDLKPHNIFLSSYGEPALGDFGISTVDDERSISAASGLSVAYAAPEVLEDASATVASDVYSLAATLYHLVEGTAPFASKQMRTTVRRILTEHPAPLSAAGGAHELSHVLQRALAKDPGDRYVSAGEFGEALRSVQAALGLDRTPMPLPQIPGGAASNRDGSPQGEQTVRRSRRDAARGAGGAAEGSDSSRPRPLLTPAPKTSARADRPVEEPEPGEQTIRRARRAAPAAPTPSTGAVAESSEPSPQRRRVAAVAGALTVLAVVIVALAFGGDDGPGDDSVAATTTALRSAIDDPDFLAPLIVPADIRVEADDDGNAEVSFTPVAGAVSYEIVSMSSPVGKRFVGTSSPIVADLAVGDVPCWKLVILGERSQFRESATVCSAG